VCLFPEGMSRYYPTVAPLKTGVARLASDVLSKCRDDPTFEVDILTCSITYMHREHFRSDVLVSVCVCVAFHYQMAVDAILVTSLTLRRACGRGPTLLCYHPHHLPRSAR